MPDIATLVSTSPTIIKVDASIIYDTIIYYMGYSIEDNLYLDIIQIDSDKYLVKFIDSKDAQRLCKLINNMMIENNIIKVEILESKKPDTHTDTNTYDTTPYTKVQAEIHAETHVETHADTNAEKNTISSDVPIHIPIPISIYERLKNTIHYIFAFLSFR